jgi:large subunit ribosomal protein L7A
MSLERIKDARKRTIGAKQTQKALEKGVVAVLFVARDADSHVTRPLADLGQSKGAEVIWVDSMITLGKACGIEVGAAAAAAVTEG